MQFDLLLFIRCTIPGISDLERAVARLAASTVEGAAGRDAAHVVLYEDAAKRKVRVCMCVGGGVVGYMSCTRMLQKPDACLCGGGGEGGGSMQVCDCLRGCG